jgi:hypothetical protein
MVWKGIEKMAWYAASTGGMTRKTKRVVHLVIATTRTTRMMASKTRMTRKRLWCKRRSIGSKRPKPRAGLTYD